jgi:hypothetical protein
MKLSWLMAALLLAGCDPGMAMRGTVREPTNPCAGGEIYGEGEPIRDAEVRVQCGDEDHARLEALTDMAGRFKTASLGILAMDCTIRVSASGFRSAHYVVGDLCAIYSEAFGGCQSFSLNAELTRDPSAAPNPLDF